MALKIRLQRGGATHAPHYRMVVADSKFPRDGRFVEILGTYDPKNKNADRQINVKLDRADYWLSVGALPSETVRSILKKARKAAPAAEQAVAADSSESA
jgi:small subunit ribosomal protein S16